ncbi:MAG: ATP-grasp domain-containing protein [Oscillospiraceae bacterium]|nr:ATP-grasp domain-containing protein [Oscillospiraceae bacterium]
MIPPDSQRKLRVGITFNIKKNAVTDPPDAEEEFDEPSTVAAVKNALETAGREVELFEATERLPVRLSERRPDMVFNIAEGMNGRGREAHVPAILNFLNIPFTGSDETAMCIAMDKALAKQLLMSHHIRTPKYKIIGSSSPFSADGLSFPVIVKPVAEGSGKGISDLSVVSDVIGLRRVSAENIGVYKQDMIAEEYIAGREFTAGILGNADEIRVFPPMEIIFRDNTRGVYSREVKRNFREFVRYDCPPIIGADIRTEIENTARKVFRILGCRDFARIDFRLSPDNLLYFIEANPLPGLAPGYSDFPILAGFCGMDYDSLIRNILDVALKRYGINRQGSKSHE